MVKESNTDYVTHAELAATVTALEGTVAIQKKLHEDQRHLEEQVKSIKVTGFSHYAGKAMHELASLASTAAGVGAVAGVLVYGAMTFAYGPYDAGKVIYAGVSGDTTLKHRHIETAKAFFAKQLHKAELDARDIQNFYLELGVVGSDDKKPSEEDVSWYALLDWIEDKD